MTNIEIPGYETVVPNQVYAREVGTLVKDSTVQASRLLFLARYRKPTKKEIVDFVVKYLETPEDSGFLPASVIKSFSPEIVRQLVSRDKQTLEHLADHLSDDRVPFGRQTLSAVSGVITTGSLRRIKKGGAKDDQKYLAELTKTGEEQFRVTTTVSAKGIFPSNKDIDKLLLKKAEPEFYCASDDYGVGERTIVEHIRLLSEAFSVPGRFSKLKDVSPLMLELDSREAFISFYSCATLRREMKHAQSQYTQQPRAKN